MIVNLANQCKVVKSRSREIGLLRICNKDKQSMKFIRNKLQRLARQLISYSYKRNGVFTNGSKEELLTVRKYRE